MDEDDVEASATGASVAFGAAGGAFGTSLVGVGGSMQTLVPAAGSSVGERWASSLSDSVSSTLLCVCGVG